MKSKLMLTTIWLFSLLISTGGIAKTPPKHTGESLPTLSPTIPNSITVTTTPLTLDSLQHDFDVFSWQSFIALNWPANKDGSADTQLTIGENQQQTTVWQAWKESRDIFLKNGQKPGKWQSISPPPKPCASLVNRSDIPKGAIHLSQAGKTPNVLDESGEPFQTGPLIDQNGQYTRYQILTNESMFNYIVDNTLYSKSGQKAFKQEVSFPESDTGSPIIGAIMVKAAWIKMGGKYNPEDFHTTQALVYDNPEEQAGVKPACKLETVGLVGFHIGHKTVQEPQWICSTFEHIANAPTQGEAAKLPAYNFYNHQSKATINQPPARPWNPAITYTTPTQVERVIPISDEVKALNTAYHLALNKAVKGKSVWSNYELISTQWPTNATSVSDPTGNPAPPFLANATLETYIQGTVRQTSSNCIACHNNATDTSGQFSDFTYLLQRAQ